jgi:hypothetical protein
MPNTCYSISLPKSSIVDMITIENPPSDHHDKHELSGSDEVDCTGLTGAGGVGLPFSDFFLETLWESLDGWAASSGSGGEAFTSGNHVYIASGNTSGGWAEIEKNVDYPFPSLSWDKARSFACSLLMQSNSSHSCNIKLGIGGIVSTGQHIGFIMASGILSAVWQGSSSHSHQIEDVSGSSFAITRKLSAVHTPGVNIKFYKDDVLVHTTTTDLPSGTSKASKVLEWLIDNASTAEFKYSRMSRYQFYQGA